MPIEPEFLRYAVQDHVATITFARPEKLNAFTRAMGADLVGLIDRADADDDVRCVILTGQGRAFCAGADLAAPGSSFAGQTAHAGQEEENGEGWRDFGGIIALRFFDCLKPVIVAFNGPAAGMGVTMALAADIRLASTTAKFVLPFVRRGIVPESASSWFLPRIVGIATALEWILTGRTVSADEGLRAGLVRSLHEPEELMPAALAIAYEIARNAAPISVALSRQLLWRMLGADHPMQAHRIESQGVYSRSRSSDIGEGVKSFLEKREPVFKDRISRDMPHFMPWWKESSF